MNKPSHSAGQLIEGMNRDDCPEVCKASEADLLHECAPEILRCAQDDKTAGCHPERSEGSLARLCPANQPHVAWRTSGESPGRSPCVPSEKRGGCIVDRRITWFIPRDAQRDVAATSIKRK